MRAPALVVLLATIACGDSAGPKQTLSHPPPPPPPPVGQYSFTVTDSSGTTSHTGTPMTDMFRDSAAADNAMNISMGDSTGAVDITLSSIDSLPSVGTYIGCPPQLPSACIGMVGQLVPPTYQIDSVVDTVTISAVSSSEVDGSFVLQLDNADSTLSVLAVLRGTFKAVYTGPSAASRVRHRASAAPPL